MKNKQLEVGELFTTSIPLISDGRFVWVAQSYLFKDEEFTSALGCPLTPDGTLYGPPFETHDEAAATCTKFEKAFCRACKKQFNLKIQDAPPPHTRN